MLTAQRKEVRALPHLPRVHRIGLAAAIPFSLRQRMQILPAAAVVRTIEQHSAAHLGKARTNPQIPRIAILPRAGVAESGDLQARRRRGNHRPIELLPHLELGIGRGRKALHFTQPFAANRLIRRLDHAGVKHRRDVHPGEHATGKDAKGIERSRRGRQGDRHVLPMNQVGTYGVVPVHIAPHRGIGVVLEEHMILAAVEARRAGVVHPVVPRQQVKLKKSSTIHE